MIKGIDDDNDNNNTPIARSHTRESGHDPDCTLTHVLIRFCGARTYTIYKLSESQGNYRGGLSRIPPHLPTDLNGRQFGKLYGPLQGRPKSG